MGKEDIRCGTDEELKDGVSKIKQMAEDCRWMREVRYAFMQSHQMVSDGVYKIIYSNGISVTVDYNSEAVTMSGNGIFKVLKV